MDRHLGIGMDELRIHVHCMLFLINGKTTFHKNIFYYSLFLRGWND